MLAFEEDHAAKYGLKEAIILHKIIYYVLLTKKMEETTTRENIGRSTPERVGVQFFLSSPICRYGEPLRTLRSNPYWLATHLIEWLTTKLVGIAFLLAY